MTDVITMEETIKEIFGKIKGDPYTDSQSEFFRELEDLLTYDTKTFQEIAKDYGTFEVVEDYGGEGQGEEYYTVFSFTDLKGEKDYFRFEGYWESWDGVYYDDTELEKVVPKEVTVIKWEAV